MDYASGLKANPSSIHAEGVKTKIKLQSARKKISGILKARPVEIIFTSGGTESNNLAIQGVVWAWREKIPARNAYSIAIAGGSEKKLPHIITTNIEHPSVLETCRMLKKRKLAEISIVPVEKNGIVDPKKIKKEIKENTALVSVMYANNEIGTIQPIREIAGEIRHYNKNNRQDLFFNRSCLFHTDAVQAANYLDLNVGKLGVDLLSLSGSKIEGAGRVGVLYKKKSAPITAIFGGGDQESGLRPGTENFPEILKFSEALESAQRIKEKETKRLVRLRNHFFNKMRHSHILKNVGMLFNGDLENRLPNNINITFPKIPSDLLVIELSSKGVMASSKSACESSRREGSYVIEAIRPESDPEIGGVRFSLGRETSKADIDYTIGVLSKILLRLKKWK